MNFLKKVFTRTNLRNFTAFLVLGLILWFLVWMRKMFGRINFDEIAIVLQIGMSGVDAGMFWSFFMKVIVRSAGWAVVLAGLVHFLGRYGRIRMLTLWTLVGLIVYNGFLAKIQCGNFCSLQTSRFYEQEYVFPTSAKIDFPTKQNVLVIVLESMERTYDDAELFGNGDLIPHIRKMEEENVSFENYNTVAGLTHTIAAITGITTGLPLFFTSYRNIEKMMGATGIGTIFKNNGYHTMAIFPASGQFSLKTNFLRRMGFDEIYDGEYLRTLLTHELEHYPFDGVDDGSLFELSRPMIEKTIATQQPYVIFMETINTHCDGYYTAACRDMGFAQETMEDIIKCEDKLVYDFVQWFRAADPTAAVILVNDHTQHTGDIMEKLTKRDSRPLNNVFINTNAFDYDYRGRTISALDFFPTIIEAAGGRIQGCRLGLGVSLSARCQGYQTLSEQYGYTELGTRLQHKNDLYYELATGRK